MDLNLLKADLKRDEGVKTKAYADTKGKITIGVGRNITDLGLNQAEIEMLLDNDIKNTSRDLDIAFPVWKTLSERRQRALANMCFNMGLAKFLQFRKMLDAIRRGDFKTAAAEALNSEWEKEVGNRAVRIANMLENG